MAPMPTTSLRNKESAPFPVARGQPIPEPVLDTRRVVARARRRGRSLVRDHPPDRVGQESGPKCAAPAVRVPEYVHGPSGVGREHLGHRRDILELALDRVRPGGIPRGPSPTPVDRVDRERRAKHRSDDPERRVIGGRAVDEHERRPITRSKDGDPGPVP